MARSSRFFLCLHRFPGQVLLPVTVLNGADFIFLPPDAGGIQRCVQYANSYIIEVVNMREREYTGTWSLHFQAPYVQHGKIIYRPDFHETVGRLGAKRFFRILRMICPISPKRPRFSPGCSKTIWPFLITLRTESPQRISSFSTMYVASAPGYSRPRKQISSIARSARKNASGKRTDTPGKSASGT